MQYSAVQHTTVWYCTVQYGAIQYSAAQHTTVRYGTVQYQYNTIQCSTVHYLAVQQCSAVYYSTVQYNAIQYSATCFLFWLVTFCTKSCMKLQNHSKKTKCETCSNIEAIIGLFGQLFATSFLAKLLAILAIYSPLAFGE